MGTTSGSTSRRSALRGGVALGLGVVAHGLPSAAAASSLGSDVASVTVEGGTTSTTVDRRGGASVALQSVTGRQ